MPPVALDGQPVHFKHQFQNVHLVPGERVRLGMASPNVSVEVTEDGGTVTGDQKASKGRRLLGAEDDGTRTAPASAPASARASAPSTASGRCQDWMSAPARDRSCARNSAARVGSNACRTSPVASFFIHTPTLSTHTPFKYV